MKIKIYQNKINYQILFINLKNVKIKYIIVILSNLKKYIYILMKQELRKLHFDYNNYHYNNTIDSIPVYNDAEPNYKQNDYLEKL